MVRNISFSFLTTFAAPGMARFVARTGPLAQTPAGFFLCSFDTRLPIGYDICRESLVGQGQRAPPAFHSLDNGGRAWQAVRESR